MSAVTEVEKRLFARIRARAAGLLKGVGPMFARGAGAVFARVKMIDRKVALKLLAGGAGSVATAVVVQKVFGGDDGMTAAEVQEMLRQSGDKSTSPLSKLSPEAAKELLEAIGDTVTNATHERDAMTAASADALERLQTTFHTNIEGVLLIVLDLCVLSVTDDAVLLAGIGNRFGGGLAADQRLRGLAAAIEATRELASTPNWLDDTTDEAPEREKAAKASAAARLPAGAPDGGIAP